MKVNYTVDFEVLGECAGAKPQVIAELNPALVRKCTPPDDGGYLVRVPVGTSSRVQTALAERGLDPSVVTVVGIGVSDPLESVDEATTDQLNRSVSFEVRFVAAEGAETPVR